MSADLTISELIAAKRAFEAKLLRFIVEEAQAFFVATGRGASDIDVTIVDISTVGDINKQFVVGGVHVTVPLE